jgi:hypothetical protein
MVKNYFKYILFYILEVGGGMMNLLCSIFSYYPRVELGIGFLFSLEKQRYEGETQSQSERRQDLNKSAKSKFSEARKVL